jgi:RAB protein geranylgeranyltransferase component A
LTHYFLLRILFSKSLSVNELIRSGVSNYLEFQNVSENFFYADHKFQKIPFSKSEVFGSSLLSFKEKRQLVKVIEACLAGYDKISQIEMTQKRINSTHIYEKEIEMSAEEQRLMLETKDQPIRVFLQKMGIEKRM